MNKFYEPIDEKKIRIWYDKKFLSLVEKEIFELYPNRVIQAEVDIPRGWESDIFPSRKLDTGHSIMVWHYDIFKKILVKEKAYKQVDSNRFICWYDTVLNVFVEESLYIKLGMERVKQLELDIPENMDFEYFPEKFYNGVTIQTWLFDYETKKLYIEDVRSVFLQKKEYTNLLKYLKIPEEYLKLFSVDNTRKIIAKKIFNKEIDINEKKIYNTIVMINKLEKYLDNQIEFDKIFYEITLEFK